MASLITGKWIGVSFLLITRLPAPAPLGHEAAVKGAVRDHLQIGYEREAVVDFGEGIHEMLFPYLGLLFP
jgi:hypothetical protein